MTKAFACPNCGAGLQHEENHGPTQICDYCRSTVIVPEEIRDWQQQQPAQPSSDDAIHGTQIRMSSVNRILEVRQLARSGQKINAIKLYRELFGVGLKEAKEAVERMEQGQPIAISYNQSISATPLRPTGTGVDFSGVESRARGWGCFWLIFTLFILGVTTVPFLLVGAGMMAIPTSIGGFELPFSSDGDGDSQGISIDLGGPLSSPQILTEAFRFGAEGSGPGYFEDMRWLAIDNQGQVYAAEFDTGRVQVFDADGTFLNQWQVNNETPLRALVVTSDGSTAYVAWGWQLHRFDALSGEHLGQMDTDGINGYEDLALTAFDELVALSSTIDEALVFYDKDGNVVNRVDDPVRTVSENTDPSLSMAIAGDGRIYVLGQISDTVYVFNEAGVFIDRFGGDGDGPGQLSNPMAIAIDGAGHIFVGDFRGVSVFDRDGQFLKSADIRGTFFDMDISQSGRLYVTNRTQIIVYDLDLDA